MRKLLFASVAAFAALSAAANASDYATTVQVFGEIFPTCAINNGGFTTYNINTSVDANGALIGGEHAADPRLRGTAWCNGQGNTITITAKPLINTAVAVPSADFTNRIDYTLSSELAGGKTVDTAGSAPAAGNTITALKDAFAGDLGAFTLTTESSGGKKMLAGGYTGDVIISVHVDD